MFLNKVWRASSVLVLLLFTSCLGVNDDMPKGSGSTLDGGPGGADSNALTAYQDLFFRFSPVSAAASTSGTTFTATGLPSWATINMSTGVISGYPPAPAATVSGITVVARTASDSKTYGPYSLTVIGDPLTNSAWHLDNTGQTSFARDAGIAGNDLDVRAVIKLGFTGKGVKVGISDTGMEIAHEDLKDNVVPNASRDYRKANPYGGDPTPTDPGFDHGTAVSGIVAARAWNGVGARGIAPEAGLEGFNFISSSQTTFPMMDQVTGDFDILNQSWGDNGINSNQVLDYGYVRGAFPDYLNAFKKGVTTYRNGKGATYVRAAGNDYYYTVTSRDANFVPTTFRTRPANCTEENTTPYVLVVGATNANGVKSSYSSIGSNIFVSGLGGEYGINRAAPVYPVVNTQPAIVTTDLQTCSKGAAQNPFPTGTLLRNDFEQGLLNNTNCNYTSIMNGTSSAAPSVAGVVALMYQVNPNLSWRDVRYILANTSTRIDPNYGPLHSNLDPDGYNSELGWVKNKANYWFSNFYGFGRVDALAAVTMAKSYVSQVGMLKETVDNTGNLLYKKTVAPADGAIPDNNVVSPFEDRITVNEDYVIEAVSVRLTLSHTFIGDLGIELTSPQGTKSILLPTNNALQSNALYDATFTTYAHYGERSVGEWVLRVLDGRATNTGTISAWSLDVLGH